jgi:hypothetical protein
VSRPASAQCVALLKSGGYDKKWVADLYYGGDRRIANLPISAPSFSDDGTSLIQSTGSCTVNYSGVFADSLTPTQAGSYLAPFGAELAVYVVITAGAFTERIQMGWYRITATPSAQDAVTPFRGSMIVVGSTVDLTLQDRFAKVQNDAFDTPGSPPSLASVFTEVVRLTGLQITREIADSAIPKTIAYESDRLQAVYDLVNVQNAVPYMRPDGTIGQRLIAWSNTAITDTVNWGTGGQLVTAERLLDSTNVYNRVAIKSSNGVILTTLQVTTGPLRAPTNSEPSTPFGRKTYSYSSPYITTPAQAIAYAPTLLAQVSNFRSLSVTVSELFNPLRQVGDVIQVVRQQETFVGRISKITRDATETQTITLETQ